MSDNSSWPESTKHIISNKFHGNAFGSYEKCVTLHRQTERDILETTKKDRKEVLEK